MLTKVSSNDLVKVGCRIPSDRLLDQVEQTMKVVTKEQKALQDLLPKGFIEEIKRVQADLQTSRASAQIRDREREDSNRFEHKAFHEAKVWRRQVASRAQRAIHLGEPVDEALANVSPAPTENALAAEVNRMLSLLERQGDHLPGQQVDKLIQRGKSIAETLGPSSLQEIEKRVATLQEPVKQFYSRKGELYLALKAINDAGRELHADSPTAAAAYNLEKLYPQTK